MSDLADFLLARIAEDERLARDAESTWSQVRIHYGTSASQEQRFAREAFVLNINPWRVLAECDAKRRIVEKARKAEEVRQKRFDARGWMEPAEFGHWQALSEILSILALPYAGHEDYREEWRP